MSDTPVFGPLAQAVYEQKYAMDGETWPDTAYRVSMEVLRKRRPELIAEMTRVITERKFIPGGRYLYAAGRRVHQTQNCLLMRATDSREGWAELMHNVVSGLMTGAGVGVDYSDLRPSGAKIMGTGGESTGPLALMQMVNEAGRHIRQGGSRRSALWAGLNWSHPDVFKFMELKDWTEEQRAAKEADFNAPAPMDGTNISVLLDDEFFKAVHDPEHARHKWAHRVLDVAVERMLEHGEPGLSIDIGHHAGETLRNACTEVTSRDDSDICNLGSLNFAAIESVAELRRIVYLATIFLLAGTEYSLVPYEKVAETRTKNRRLGLGIMGLAEWLAKRGYKYEMVPELKEWMQVYSTALGIAHEEADRWGVSRPVAATAIAPAGTISIIAETTSGIEPIYAVAFKRRYAKGDDWHYQYVIDSAAERIIAQGVDPETIETAFDLARDPARRLRFQAEVQQYVDQGISSTLNLPSPEDRPFTAAEFRELVLEYAPRLRGFTVYPDGSRGGQPLVPVSYSEAKGRTGVEYKEHSNEDACRDGVCGI